MAGAREIAKSNGVVGAGGAAFPAYVKLSSGAEIVIANAAECEPLLYKDEEILRRFFDVFLKGLLLAKEAVGADRCIIGIKEKHPELIEEIRAKVPEGVEVFVLRDTYPSGDEFLLVYDATRRLIPRGGIPPDAGVVVQNVETLYNIGDGKPVTEKFVTVSGDVERAVTLKAPIGMSWHDLVKELKIDTRYKKFIFGGPMMGFVSDDIDVPVTKADSGLLILPADHPLIAKKSRTSRSVEKIAYSCDQCMRCSDLCPRDLLGHGVKPHRAMISIAMDMKQKDSYQRSSLYCCECGLCTLYACPEDLDPSKVMVMSKRELFKRGERPGREFPSVNPMYEYRRTPTKLLVKRLGLEEFVRPHVFIEERPHPAKIELRLDQHRGEAAGAVVKKGQVVKRMELVAETEEGKMGSRIFSSIDGTVTYVSKEKVIIEAG